MPTSRGIVWKGLRVSNPPPPTIPFFVNWNSLHARLNSHYKAWSYKKKKYKKIKANLKHPYFSPIKASLFLMLTFQITQVRVNMRVQSVQTTGKCLYETPRSSINLPKKSLSPHEKFLFWDKVSFPYFRKEIPWVTTAGNHAADVLFF